MVDISTKMISQRTKSALSEIKSKLKNGTIHISKSGNKVKRLGTPDNLTAEGRLKSAKTRRDKALNDENNRRAYAFASTFKHQTLKRIATALNINDFKTSTGVIFTPVSVSRLIKLYNEKR